MLDAQVNVQIKVNSSGGVSRLGFGTIAMLSYQTALFGANPSLSFARLADAISAGFAPDSPEAMFIARVKAQSPSVRTVKLLKASHPTTLAYRLDVASLINNEDYELNVTGEGVTPSTPKYTSDANATNDEIAAGLVAALQAVAGRNFTAATAGAVGALYVTVTANAAGDYFTLEALNTAILTITNTTADPGIVADLNAARVADPDWYWLYTPSASKAIVDVVDAWVEATPFKVYVPDVVDSDVENTADGGADVAAETKAKGLKRTHLLYSRKPSEMRGAGVAAVVAWRNPGSWTLAYQTIDGCTPDSFTETQFQHLDAKRVSYYKAEANASFIWEGKVGNVDYGYLDVTVALDFVLDGLQKAGFSYLKARSAAGKVAYSDADIRGFVSALEGFIDLCKTDQYKLVAPGTPGSTKDPEPSIIAPKVADIDPASREVRDLPDIEINFRLQTAVHTVGVTVNVTK